MENPPYLYRPIAMYGGSVLKCCGIASAYLGDRIVKDGNGNYIEFKG